MKFALLLVGLLCLHGLQAASVPKKKPFSDLKRYSVNGLISLPYAEIVEPFFAWYDADQYASRIDYYNGMVNTIQLAPTSSKDFGVGVKIAPLTDESVTNVKTCFWINGTSDAPLAIQSVIPDLDEFEYAGKTTYIGLEADQWQSITHEGDKKNTYTFYINTVTGEPLYYEMIGYDSLLGSHYDRYYIQYSRFDTAPIDPKTFAITTSMKCGDFPGPGLSKVLANPMMEFINNDESHLHPQFDQFKKKHDKKYETQIEHKERLHLFRQNSRYVSSMNRKGLTYSLAINHLGDKSDEELKVLRGKLKSKSGQKNNGKKLDMSKYTKEQKSLPDSFDWRIFGAVTPVKDQGICGSCWSFGTTGAIEGAYFNKYNSLIRLSQQNLVDCSWGFGNNGCEGGEDYRAYDWIIKHGGITLADSYGPYLQQDGYCHFNNATIGAKLTGYLNIEPTNEAVKTALVNEGPISIGIDAAHKSLVFYDHGIYYEPDCGNGVDDLDHAVLLVGYGKIKGQDYWLVKNSWSTFWGNDGYVLMSQKDNNCGVTTQTTFPLVA